MPKRPPPIPPSGAEVAAGEGGRGPGAGGPQPSKAQARLRARADQAARAADQGDDRAYRLLAEALRRLLRGE